MIAQVMEGFGLLLGYVFMLQVAGIIWDIVVRAFEGKRI